MRGFGPVRPMIAALLLLPLAACGGGGDNAERQYPPMSFSYLTPLRLNVGAIQIEDHVPPPGPDDLAAQSPEAPEQALKQMAQDRLVAAGNSGTAVFTIDQASITGQPGGVLSGTAAVHLDIIGKDGAHAGYAEAHVSRQFVPGTDGGDAGGVRGELYDLTRRMMQDMNVEFEFQVRRTLSDWLLDASGAPAADSVQQQNLGAPGSGSPLAAPPSATPSSVGAPLQLAPSGPVPAVGGTPAPAAAGSPANPAAPVAAVPATPMSPPPGFLSLPSSATPKGY